MAQPGRDVLGCSKQGVTLGTQGGDAGAVWAFCLLFLGCAAIQQLGHHGEPARHPGPDAREDQWCPPTRVGSFHLLCGQTVGNHWLWLAQMGHWDGAAPCSYGKLVSPEVQIPSFALRNGEVGT